MSDAEFSSTLATRVLFVRPCGCEPLAQVYEYIRGQGGDPDIRPLFTRDCAQLDRERRDAEQRANFPLPDLTRWLRVDAADASAAKELADKLSSGKMQFEIHQATESKAETRHVPSTWVRAGRTWLTRVQWKWALARSRLSRTLAGTWVADLSADQGYLLSAPWGLGMTDVAGWPFMFGRAVRESRAMRVAVIDDYFHLSHPDLADIPPAEIQQDGVSLIHHPHGTAVLGLLFPRRDREGLIGIAAGASPVLVYPYTRQGALLYYDIADAVSRATQYLGRGDVLLIERHVISPAQDYLPMETIPPCRDAMRVAVAKGIIVIEPAGNGSDRLLKLPAEPFGPPRCAWHSGAIMVGATLRSTPAQGRHGVHDPGTSYGPRIDASAWGTNVLTAKVAARYRMSSLDSATDYGTLSLTSAASAQVAGAVAIASCVARNLAPSGVGPAPWTLRTMLVATGTPSHLANAGKPCGVQPDLLRLLRAVRADLYKTHCVRLPDLAHVSELGALGHWMLKYLANGLGIAEMAEAAALDNHTVQTELDRLYKLFGLKKSAADSWLRLARVADWLEDSR